jgi:hypothetical protein
MTSSLVVADVDRIVRELLELTPDAFASVVWTSLHIEAGI